MSHAVIVFSHVGMQMHVAHLHGKQGETCNNESGYYGPAHFPTITIPCRWSTTPNCERRPFTPRPMTTSSVPTAAGPLPLPEIRVCKSCVKKRSNVLPVSRLYPVTVRPTLGT